MSSDREPGFVATFPGACDLCGGEIRDTRIVQRRDHWVHVGCWQAGHE